MAAAARKTNDDDAAPEAQPAPSSPPDAAETAAPAAPTLPVPPPPPPAVPACPNCKRGQAERYAGTNPHKRGTGWCGQHGRVAL